MKNLLWMTEDELREACWLLMACVVRSEEEKALLLNNMKEMVADGYRCGYADAFADRALQVPHEAQERDAASFGLH